MADRIIRPDRGVTGDDASPLLDMMIHLTGLVPVGLGVVAVGQPAAYLFALLPIGPFVLGRPLAGRRRMGLLHRARATELGLTMGGAMLVVFAVLAVALNVDALAVFIPIGILAVMGVAANWVFLTASAVSRAARRLTYPHPWVLELPFLNPPDVEE